MVQTKIRFYDCNGKIILVRDEIRAKMPQKPKYEWKKIRISGENGLTSKLKHRKAHNSIFPFYLGDLVTRPGDQQFGVVSGRFPDNPGELACMGFVLSL